MAISDLSGNSSIGGQKIKKRVCIAGLGGLGTNVSSMIIRMGITELTLIDDDIIEITNLQRQTLFDEKDLGMYKADVLKIKLSEISPDSRIIIYKKKIDNSSLELIKAHLVIDCTDNLQTKFLLNKLCIQNNIPLICGSVVGDHGFVKLITPETGCLECFYGKAKKPETSADEGILNTAVALASSIQAKLAMDYLAYYRMDSRLISFDVWNNTLTKIFVKKNKNCGVCST